MSSGRARALRADGTRAPKADAKGTPSMRGAEEYERGLAGRAKSSPFAWRAGSRPGYPPVLDEDRAHRRRNRRHDRGVPWAAAAIARRIAQLPVVAATVVVAAYGLYPALNNVNLSDFHPEVVAVPALLGAMYFGLTRRWLPYAACVGVVLLTKEDMTLVVASLGV